MIERRTTMREGPDGNGGYSMTYQFADGTSGVIVQPTRRDALIIWRAVLAAQASTAATPEETING